jgi:hypothetical protein
MQNTILKSAKDFLDYINKLPKAIELQNLVNFENIFAEAFRQKDELRENFSKLSKEDLKTIVIAINNNFENGKTFLQVCEEQAVNILETLQLSKNNDLHDLMSTVNLLVALTNIGGLISYGLSTVTDKKIGNITEGINSFIEKISQNLINNNKCSYELISKLHKLKNIVDQNSDLNDDDRAKISSKLGLFATTLLCTKELGNNFSDAEQKTLDKLIYENGSDEEKYIEKKLALEKKLIELCNKIKTGINYTNETKKFVTALNDLLTSQKTMPQKMEEFKTLINKPGIQSMLLQDTRGSLQRLLDGLKYFFTFQWKKLSMTQAQIVAHHLSAKFAALRPPKVAENSPSHIPNAPTNVR